jgi:ribonucleoside-triphosphate reductase
MRHGTLSIGFVGLAEALTALTGNHHGESEEARGLGLSIISKMREQCDRLADLHDKNFSLMATPAEQVAGRTLNCDKEIFGEIEGVTDKEYYTNSFHVPVWQEISLFEKVKIEGPYHQHTNGGHISYVELPSSPEHNLEAVDKIIRQMAENDMGYGAINFPIDECVSCHFQSVINDDNCPECGSTDIRRIRRITGYFSTVDRFNDSKKAELDDRLVHKVI